MAQTVRVMFKRPGLGDVGYRHSKAEVRHDREVSHFPRNQPHTKMEIFCHMRNRYTRILGILEAYLIVWF